MPGCARNLLRPTVAGAGRGRPSGGPFERCADDRLEGGVEVDGPAADVGQVRIAEVGTHGGLPRLSAGGGHRTLLHASDSVAVQAEERQFAVGESSCVQAWDAGS
ncbi:hypothetical protein ACQEU3_38645 [Spirillospora sp. CA-253888]